MQKEPTIVYYLSHRGDSNYPRATMYVLRNSVFDSMEEAIKEVKYHKNYYPAIVKYDLTNDLNLERIESCLIDEIRINNANKNTHIEH